MEFDMIIIYLLAIVGLSCIGAAILYCVCYLTANSVQVVEQPRPRRAQKRVRELYRIHREIGQEEERSSMKELDQWPVATTNEPLVADGRQTMCSSLLQPSLTDKDVLLATAISQIPLKELGGKDNDIIVDVNQQLYVNKEDKAQREEHQCIVCKARKEIAWDQLSCYAQTTIGVLAYKRTISSLKNLLPNSKGSKSPVTSKEPE